MLKNKTVVIVGGAGLLGQEFVKSTLKNGANVFVMDSCSKDNWNKLNISDVYFISSDITNDESVKSSIDKIAKCSEEIDSLVNSAYPKNINYGRHFFDVNIADFNGNVAMHLGGYFLTCQQFAKYFKNQGYGNIINVASVYGVIPPRFEIYNGTKMTTPVEYAIIKAGIIHLTKYMAEYLKGSNIRVNCISPGGILNKQPKSFLKAYKRMSLSKGILDKSDINGTLLYLLSDMSKYVNGQNIIVDDGFSL